MFQQLLLSPIRFIYPTNFILDSKNQHVNEEEKRRCVFKLKIVLS